MALLKVICWALIFIIRIRLPPGKSLATLVEFSLKYVINVCTMRCQRYVILTLSTNIGSTLVWLIKRGNNTHLQNELNTYITIYKLTRKKTVDYMPSISPFKRCLNV